MLSHKTLLCFLLLSVVGNVNAIEAKNENNCKICDEAYMKSHHFDQAYKCRGCFFNVYNELNAKFSVPCKNGRCFGREIYCGCPIYDEGGIKFEKGPLACNYEPPAGKSDDKKIDIEHIVPKSRFKNENPSISAEKFNMLTNDFHNMYPGIRKINNKRQVKPYSEGKITSRQYGRCETTIGNDFIHPRDSVKGQIARAYLYMDSIGAIRLSKDEKTKYYKWHDNHPPEKEECEREKIIFSIQGKRNPFISNFCK
jgi:deoxyribonuclease-1